MLKAATEKGWYSAKTRLEVPASRQIINDVRILSASFEPESRRMHCDSASDRTEDGAHVDT